MWHGKKKVWKHLCEEGDEKVKSQATGSSALKQVMPQDMKGFFNYTGSSYILIWELLYSYFFH